MSALKCPVCSGAMREASRNGVMIDTCTRCRGVWLDRGELDKLLSGMRGADRDDGDDRRYHSGDNHGYPRKKRSKIDSFMEIFD